MEATRHNRIEVSCDTGTRLALAAAWLDSYPADAEILIIGPTAEAADDLYLGDASSKAARFGIRRFTLTALASHLASPALADSGLASATAISFVAVVARAIHSLHNAGKLTYFAPVATRPGFPIAVSQTLEELRMNEVELTTIERLSNGGSDLSLIAQAVERELDESRLADRAVIFRAAIDVVRSASNLQLLGLPLLVLDLPLRTRLEHQLIRELTLCSPAVQATAPAGDKRAIEALETALDCKQHISIPTVPANSLLATKQHLFAESPLPSAACDDSLHVSSWPGEPRECVEIVRKVQNEAARGVAFDQMAVLLNSSNEYRSHLEEAFNRAEIPVYFARGSTAPDPAGRAMLALLACAAEGLSARRFAEYLSLGQVPDPDDEKNLEDSWVGPRDELVSDITQTDEAGTVPRAVATGSPARTNDGAPNSAPAKTDSLSEEAGTVPRAVATGSSWHTNVGATNPTPTQTKPLPADPENRPVIEGNLRAPWRWERLLVDSAVIGGKDRWVRRLDGLANELQLQHAEAQSEESSHAERLAKQLRDLEHLRAFAIPTVELLAALPNEATWGEWLIQLNELALRTVRDPSGVLATLAELEPMAPVGPVDLYAVQLVLEPRLSELSIPPQRRRYGCVFVGPVEMARGLSFEVVFIPGLAEKIFPRKLVEDSILPDRQRHEAAAGILTTRHNRLELERLAFQLCIGAARERVYLSYSRIDLEKSRPRVPSFYALEALQAAEGRLLSFEEFAARAESATRARLGWPAPQHPADAIDESEYDLALLGGLVDAEPESATGSARYLLSANPHLARALRARFHRWSWKWTQNDGLVDPDDLGKKAMERHRFTARAFSATALEHYASCPYRFFLSSVFRLRPREDVAAIEVLDPLTRGALFHGVQFAILTKLKADGLLPLNATLISRAWSVVDVCLDEVAGYYEDKLVPAIPRVWRDAIDSIRADLREWLRRMSVSDDGWVPDKFEFGFAMNHIGSQDRDPDSVSEPVEIAGGLRLRGSIDLVERHANGKLRVTDHKTGKARTEKNLVVGGGGSLQPLLYALACEESLKQPVESGRLYYCTAAGGYAERIVPLDDKSREMITSVVAAIDEALVNSFFPAAPEDGACGWCDFRAVCGPSEEFRTQRKPAERLAQLTNIRELP